MNKLAFTKTRSWGQYLLMPKKIKQIPFTEYKDPVELYVKKLNDKGQGIAH